MSVKNGFFACFVYLVCFFVTKTTDAATVCFDCQQIDDAADCKAFKTCGTGENCYHEVVETEDGLPKYSWGCASPQLCALEANLSTRRKRLNVQKCFECCDSNFCNYGGCTTDFCGSVTCKNNGTCLNTPLHHVCNCTTGYTGEFCEIDIDECNSSPCQNGATCTDLVGYYTCTCLPGYTGANCQTDIDECASDPCANGATCVDHVNGFTCDCVPGYTGTLCDYNIDECESSPCQYNSTCTDLVNGYTCDCIPGITGIDCEININECANVTCLNGGVCQDFIDSFVCLCEFGFSGRYCETSLGRVCYSCENGIDDPVNCTNAVICGLDEECYMEHELVSVGVANFNLGCVTRGMCTVLEQSRRRRYKPIQLCYECCDVNGCNHHACADSRGTTL